jgi:hypothetical protein
MVAIFVIVSLILAQIVSRRSPEYLGILIAVAIALFATLLWRSSRSFATPALLLATTYIVTRLLVHHVTVLEVRKTLHTQQLMVGPHPLDPRQWDVVAQTGNVYRFGVWSWKTRLLTLEPEMLPVAKPSAEFHAALRKKEIRGFVKWIRFPIYEVERKNGVTRVHLHDARYAARRKANGGFGDVSVTLP